MRHVRFAAMAAGFLRETVGAWPALRFEEAKHMLFNAVLPALDGVRPVPRSGFGPRLIYVVGGQEEADEAIGRMGCTTRRPPRGRSGQA